MTEELSLIADTDRTVEAPALRSVQTYKIVSGNSLTDLENKVAYALSQNSSYQVHGDIQMYSYSEFVQVLIGYRYVA